MQFKIHISRSIVIWSNFHRFTQRCEAKMLWERYTKNAKLTTLPNLARLRTRQHTRTQNPVRTKVCREDHPAATQISSRRTPLKRAWEEATPRRMLPNSERWRKTTHLISQRNSIPYPVRNSALWCGKLRRPAPKLKCAGPASRRPMSEKWVLTPRRGDQRTRGYGIASWSTT